MCIKVNCSAQKTRKEDMKTRRGRLSICAIDVTKLWSFVHTAL
jgi:hypothetical protein|eukprot:COSAG06_NODE_2496_length_6759_cov_20.866967_1_plen_43_part_00